MSGARILTMSIAWAVMAAPSASAQDLSRYREYRLGMSPLAVAGQAGIVPETRVVHDRPALIEELVWMAPASLGAEGPEDSARRMLFSFYNGQLFHIAVSYAWDRTEGMTVEDVVGVLSMTYGPVAATAAGTGAAGSWGQASGDRIVARWEDARHSLVLIRPSYVSTFGLVMVSKPLEALAWAARIEAIRLDERDAPTRARERREEQEGQDRAREEAVRRANLATFRP
jgi:hypothetical protein